MQIIRIHPIRIIELHLVILKTTFLPLVALVQTTLKWNYLISVQIHGRRKLHIHSAHLSKFIFACFSSHPFSISRYGVVSLKSSVLIMGGWCDGKGSSSGSVSGSLIAKYTIDKWEHVGNLQTRRDMHRAIANEDRIYVIGGEGNL